MIDFDECSTDALECFAVTGGDTKRVEVDERKMTEGDRKLCRRANEAELQSWPDHKVFDVVNRRVADTDRVMRVRWVLTWHQQSQGTPLRPGISRPRLDSPRLPAQVEALILRCVASDRLKLVSGGIKTRFLSGGEEHRNIFILLPDDVREILKLSPESMLRLRKTVYGLVNARRNGGIVGNDHFGIMGSHIVRWIRAPSSASNKTKAEV